MGDNTDLQWNCARDPPPKNTPLRVPQDKESFQGERVVVKVSEQAITSKHTWFYTATSDRLHFITDADVGGDFRRRTLDFGGQRGLAACGLGSKWFAPTLGALAVLPRCKSCCKRLGIPPGDGIPSDDEAAIAERKYR